MRPCLSLPPWRVSVLFVLSSFFVFLFLGRLLLARRSGAWLTLRGGPLPFYLARLRPSRVSACLRCASLSLRLLFRSAFPALPCPYLGTFPVGLAPLRASLLAAILGGSFSRAALTLSGLGRGARPRCLPFALVLLFPFSGLRSCGCYFKELAKVGGRLLARLGGRPISLGPWPLSLC